jgi:hypothetical protein
MLNEIRVYCFGFFVYMYLVLLAGASFSRSFDEKENSEYNKNNGYEKELTCDEVEQVMGNKKKKNTHCFLKVLYSLGDHNTFLRFNREPCDKMIEYLKKYFNPHKPVR